METSGNKKRIIRTGISTRSAQKRDIYPGINDKYAVAPSKDQLDFVVPWQISDNAKNPVSL